MKATTCAINGVSMTSLRSHTMTQIEYAAINTGKAKRVDSCKWSELVAVR